MKPFIINGHNISSAGVTTSPVYNFRRNAKVIEMFLNVTVETGTNPTLDVICEFSMGDGFWWEGAAFSQVSEVSNEVIEQTSKIGTMMRFKYTVVGEDADFTFQIGANAK